MAADRLVAEANPEALQIVVKVIRDVHVMIPYAAPQVVAEAIVHRLAQAGLLAGHG